MGYIFVYLMDEQYHLIRYKVNLFIFWIKDFNTREHFNQLDFHKPSLFHPVFKMTTLGLKCYNPSESEFLFV